MLADAAVMDGEGTLGRGHGNGGRGLRRQRSLEWRERRGYGPSAQSSSDDEENSRHAVGAASVSSAGRGARSPGQVFASLLAQQYGSEWWCNWCLMLLDRKPRASPLYRGEVSRFNVDKKSIARRTARVSSVETTTARVSFWEFPQWKLRLREEETRYQFPFLPSFVRSKSEWNENVALWFEQNSKQTAVVAKRGRRVISQRERTTEPSSSLSGSASSRFIEPTRLLDKRN